MATHQCPHCKTYSRDNELHLECMLKVAEDIISETPESMPKKRAMKMFKMKFGDEEKTHEFVEQIPDADPTGLQKFEKQVARIWDRVNPQEA